MSSEINPVDSTTAIERPRAPWVIEPVRAELFQRLREFFRYRRITWFFAVRSVKDMYEGTVLGKIWLFRPIIPMLITSLIFGVMLGVPSDGLPYPLFFIAGGSLWMMFERSMMWVTRSLDGGKSLVKKLYFPRLVLPVSAASPAFLYFLVFLIMILLSCVYYFVRYGDWYLVIGPQLLLLPVLGLGTLLLAVSFGLFTAVWQTRAKDVRYAVRYAMRFWQFLTPVIYPLSQVPEEYRLLISLNPVTGYVETFRWALFGAGLLDLRALGMSVGLTVLIFWAGLWYFTKEETASVDRM